MLPWPNCCRFAFTTTPEPTCDVGEVWTEVAIGVGIGSATGEIAKKKLKDLNTSDVDQGAKIIAGSARAMGLEVTGA